MKLHFSRTIDANAQTGDPKFRSLFGPVVLFASVVILKAAVSRLHDLGWTGWVVLLAFVAEAPFFQLSR